MEVTDQDGTPVPGQLVNFASVRDGCATTQNGATALETNDQEKFRQLAAQVARLEAREEAAQ